MKVRLVFYGGLKQEIGSREQVVEIDQDHLTILELRDVLRAKYPTLSPRLETVAYVVKDTIVDPDYLLRDGDEAGLLPPVSGG